MIAQQAVQAAQQGKWASRGLAALSGRTRNRALRGLLSGGSKVASALGFDQALGTGLPPYVGMPPPRPGGRRRRNRRRRNRRTTSAPRASNAGVSVTSGASTVGAGNAPVAFARTDQLAPMFRAAPSDSADGMIVHAVEYVTQPTFAATAGQFGTPLFTKVGPQSTTLFPWLSSMAPLFQRYRMKFLRLHFQHFAATSAQGQLLLQFYPDPSYNNGVSTGLTQAIVSELGNFMTGACYEDWCHTADLSGIDKSQWFDCQVSPPTDDVNSNYCGIIGVHTMNSGVASQPPPGNFWVEAVFEFKGRSMSSVTVGLNQLRSAITSRLPAERKLRLSAKLLTSMVEEYEANLRARKDARSADPVLELEQKFLSGGNPKESPWAAPQPDRKSVV